MIDLYVATGPSDNPYDIMTMKMKAIITEHALSSGPKLVEGEHRPDDKMFAVPNAMDTWRDYYHRSDFHLTKRDASDDVLNRFVKRMQSLKKQLADLAAKRDAALKAIAEFNMD